MGQNTWKSGVSGAWGTAADWVGGVPNSITADATIAAAGTYTVTLAAGTSYSVDSVDLSDGTANFSLLGTLALGGTLATYTFDGNRFTLGSAGEVIGGTLDIDSGTLVNQGGVLATSDFILGGGATVALGGKALTLGGSSLLQGYIVGNNSAGSALVISGNAEFTDSAQFLNKTTLVDAGSIDQASSLYIAYGSSTDSTSVTIDSGASYDITGGGIFVSGTATVSNAGLFEATGGLSGVEAMFNNTGTILAIAGSEVQLEDGGSIGGTLAGAGEIDFDGGSFLLSPSIAISVATLGLDGGTVTTGGSLNLSNDTLVLNAGTLILGGSLNFAGNLSFAGTTIELNGHNLTLASPSLSGNGEFSGPGTVVLTGTGSNSGFNLGGGVELQIAGTLVQNANSDGFYLSNGGGDSATIVVDAGAVYDAVSDTNGSNINDQGGVGVVINAGLIDSSNTGSGSYNIWIATVDSTGTIESSVGEFQLDAGGTLGGSLSGAGLLDLAGGVFTLSPSLAVSVATLEIDGTVLMGAGFDLTDLVILNGDGGIALNGHSLTLANTLDVLDGAIIGNGSAGNTLVVSSAALGIDTTSESIEGNATLIVKGTVTQVDNALYLGSTASDASAISILAGAVYDLKADAVNSDGQGSQIYSGGDATLFNAGLLESTGTFTPGYFSDGISAVVYNTGTILAASGTDLQLSGGGHIGGTLTGAGEIDLAGGVFTLTPTAVSVATLGILGTVSLATGLAYGGVFNLDGGDLALNGHNVTLSGLSDLNGGGELVGAGTLKVTGHDVLNGFNVSSGAVLEDAGTITQTGNLQLGVAAGDAGTLQIDAGAVFNDAAQNASQPYIDIDGNGSIVNAGLLEFTGYSNPQAGSEYQANIKNTGTILETGNGVNFTGNLVNDGLVTFSAAFGINGGAYSEVTGAITADTGKTGTIAIGADSILTTESGISGQNIAFTASGTLGGELVLGAFGSFASTISGFSTGDSIDLQDVLANSYSYANNILSLSEISNGSTVVVGSLALSSITGTIGLTTDGASGTDIVLNNTGTSYSNPNNTTTQSNWNGVTAAWTTAADWSPTGVPGTLAYAVFSSGNSYKVSYATTDSVYQLQFNDGGGTLAISSGKLTVEDGGNLYGTLALAGGVFDAANGFTIEGAVTEAAAGTLEVDTGPLNLEGNAVLAGTIKISTNIGWVDFVAGTATLNSGFNIAGGELAIFAASAVTLGASQTIAVPAQFSAGSFDLNSHTLALSGSSLFADAYQVEGPGTLAITGTAQLAGLDLTGNARLLVSGLAEQEQAFVVGAGDSSSVSIASTGIYDFADNGAADSMTEGGTGSLINAGLLEVTGYGNDVQSIALPVINAGTILVNEGELQLQSGGSLSGTISGAGTIDLYSGTFAPSASLVVNIANFDIGGNIPVLSLGGHTLVLSTDADFGPTTQLDGSGRLKITGSADINTLYIAYNAVIEDAGTIVQTGPMDLGYDSSLGQTTSDSSTLLIDAGATYALQGDGPAEQIYSYGTAPITNNGLLETSGFFSAGQDSSIGASFVNTGTVLVNAADLQFGGGGIFGGTLAGTGEIDFTGSYNYTLTSLSASIATLNVSGGNVTLGSNITYAGDFIDNGGVIDLNGHSLTLSNAADVITATVEGAGTLKVLGTVSVSSPSYDAFLTNGAVLEDAGTLNFSSGNVLFLGATTGDTGYLNIDAGHVLNFIAGEIYSNGVGSVTNSGLLSANPGAGGVVTINAPFTNASTGTITVASGELSLDGGAILGGTLSGLGDLDLGAGNFTLASTVSATIATLSIEGQTTLSAALNYTGDLVLDNGTIDLNGENLTLSNQAVLGGIVGGPGTVKVTGIVINPAYVVAGAVLEDAGTISFNSNSDLQLGEFGGDPGYLNIDAGHVFSLTQGEIYGEETVNGGVASYYNSVTNNGLLTANPTAGSSVSIDALFTNGATGTVAVTSGELSMGEVITNLNNGTLTGGTWEAFASGTLEGTLDIDIDPPVTTDAANIILSGSGADIITGASTPETLEASLVSIASTGTLQNLGRTYSAAVSLANAGSIILGGGVFAPATLGNTGTVTGTGTLGAVLQNSGNVLATGGTLVLAHTVTGTGTLGIATASDLVLQGGVASSQKINFSGTGEILTLDAPSTMLGTISGIAIGDTIDIASASVTSTTLTGNKLAITLAGGSVVTETFATTLTNERFAISSDGHSGSNLTLYRAATATLTPTTISFGQHHVGDTVSSGLTLVNTQSIGSYSENLDASFASAGTGLTDSGSVTLLAPGSTAANSLTIGLITGTAGTVAGDAVITLSTDGTGVDGNGPQGIGSDTIVVTGTVFNEATAALGTTLALGAHHVGSSVVSFITLANSAAAGAYSEGLDVSLSGTSLTAGSFTDSGGILHLAAGGTNSNSLAVTLGTGAAGSISGAVTLGLTSDGTGIDTLGTTSLASQAVTVTGAAYNYASPTLASTIINFGIVHAGSSLAQKLVLSDYSSNPAYTEALDAAFTGTSGSATDSGTISLLGAGATNSSSLSVGLAATGNGTITGTATLGLTSDGTGIDGLGTTALGSQIVTLTGTVDNYATAALELVSGTGTLTASNPTTYLLNLGTIAAGTGNLVDGLGALNSATGLADLLSGAFTTSTVTGFTNAGFGTFSGLGAGQADTAPLITLSGTSAGTFSEFITLSSTGSNASGYSGALAKITLDVTGVVSSGTIPGVTYTLTTGADTISAGGGNDTIVALSGGLSTGDLINGGGGTNTLVLQGGGTFDMRAPTTLSNIQFVDAQENTGTLVQTLYLDAGFTGTVSAASGTAGSSFIVYGNTDSAHITLGTGNDLIYLGSANESVNGGGGNDNFYVTAADIGATINGGSGANTLSASGGGTFAMGANITSISSVILNDSGTQSSTFTANAIANLAITGGNGNDVITLGAASQSVTTGTGTTIIDAAAAQAGALIVNNGSATLNLTTGGNATLNVNDDFLTVSLSSATNLMLAPMSFLTAIGSSGNDTITALATQQTLTGGAGADTLVGYSGFSDLFQDTMAGLNGDTLQKFGGNDLIDITNLARASASVSYTGSATAGTLSVSESGVGVVSTITFTAGTNLSASLFHLSSDGHGGSYIG